jgi:nitroreductase
MAWERKPPQMKAYPGLEVVPLPDRLDADPLARLLFLSAGVVRAMSMAGETMWFRAAGSAGNLAPVEVYVVDAGGVFHYQPVEHGLVRLGDVPAGTPRSLVLTGVPWRTCWKYRERGFRHLWWDAGTMLAHILALAPDARVELGFVDSDVAALVGAEPSYEIPLAVVGLDGHSGLPAHAGRAVPAGLLADDPFEFPLVSAAFDAGVLSDRAEVEAWRAAAAGVGRAVAPLGQGGPPADLEDAVRRRGSTRWFSRAAAVPRDLVDDLAWAASAVPGDFVGAARTLLQHHLLVHSVEGVDAGGYRWGEAGLEDIATGDVRAAGRHLCLDQALGGDGSLTVFHGADLEEVVADLGDRGYRAANLEAGVVEGRLHLAAYARGLGATGLTFYDEAVRTFFDTDAWPLLVTAVGPPGYRSRRGGTPRRPVWMVPR